MIPNGQACAFHLCEFLASRPTMPSCKVSCAGPKRGLTTHLLRMRGMWTTWKRMRTLVMKEEIPGVKATPQASGADTSQPGPSLPKHWQLKPSQHSQLLYHSVCLEKDGDLCEDVIVTYWVYGHVQRVCSTSLVSHTVLRGCVSLWYLCSC